MKSSKSFLAMIVTSLLILSPTLVIAGGTGNYGEEDPNKKILKGGLLGAGTGAIASGASGGDAGKGALIGAGTNVIGGALLDTLTAPPKQAAPAQYYSQGYAPQPQYQQGYAPQTSQQAYYADQNVQQQAYYPPQPVYQAAPPREDANMKVLKSGLLGAGTGAIASSASGGSAGKGALIGAGTNVIGGALLDMLSTPSQPQQQQYYAPPPPQGYYQQQAPSGYGYPQAQQPQKKIIRKYDAQGNVISEEEVYQ
jgi:hypothetical protein